MSENLTDKLPPDSNERLLATLESIDNRLKALDTRLTAVEEQGARNSYNTRPIWEKVLVRLEGFDSKQDSFEKRQIGFEQKLLEFEAKLGSLDSKVTSLDSKVDEQGLDMRSGFKRLARQKAELAADTIAVRTDQMDLERRMDRLEDKYGDRSGQ